MLIFAYFDTLVYKSAGWDILSSQSSDNLFLLMLSNAKIDCVIVPCQLVFGFQADSDELAIVD